MARVLAVTWNGGGNVPPLIRLCQELVARGHAVRVLGHPEQRRAVEQAGLAFVGYRHARPWDPCAPVSGVRFMTGYLGTFTDRGPGADLTEELEREPAELVVADAMSLAAIRAAEQSGFPTAVLVHVFHRYLTRVWARGPVGLVATLKGLRPGRLWAAAGRVLVATDPDLDPDGRLPQSATTRSVGVLQPPARPATPVGAEPPLVLVSLSTIFFPGQEGVLQNVLDGLEGLPVRVLATVGEAVDRASLRIPPGMEVITRRPHGEVMPEVSLVIGHGGHATTMFALAHGVPVLVLPVHPRLDQPMVGRAVADAGAGRTLPADSDPAAVREAVTALLEDGDHRRAAAAIGHRLRTADAAGTAADELELMLRGEAPARRCRRTLSVRCAGPARRPRARWSGGPPRPARALRPRPARNRR
jgi:UDP:flavonoid glycosyltransferase YjiC (YdhE family)